MTTPHQDAMSLLDDIRNLPKDEAIEAIERLLRATWKRGQAWERKEVAEMFDAAAKRAVLEYGDESGRIAHVIFMVADAVRSRGGAVNAEVGQPQMAGENPPQADERLLRDLPLLQALDQSGETGGEQQTAV